MRTLEPVLRDLPRVRLIPGVTPLHPLQRILRDAAGSPVYIKRDDLTGLGPGGNKLRSLEFIMGDALQQGADCIIASGPGQSNLCTLAAAACARLGLPCVLVVNSGIPERKEGNLLLDDLLGARMVYAGNVDSAVRTARVDEEYARLVRAGHHPYIVKNGATTGWGVLGYTAAAEEIRDQCRAAGLGRLTLFAPGGNGGVAAGLIYGNALLDQPMDIVIISVEDEAAVLTDHIEKVLRETEKITGIPCPKLVGEISRITDAYRGKGWGSNTEESAAMVRDFARQEGIFIENIYNSKVLVGMKDWLEKGLVKGPACYLHTGGFGSLFSQY